MPNLDPHDRVYGDDAPQTAMLCRWFAKCDNIANGLRPHPILDQVPICKRCDDKMERIEAS